MASSHLRIFKIEPATPTDTEASDAIKSILKTCADDAQRSRVMYEVSKSICKWCFQEIPPGEDSCDCWNDE